MILSHQEWDQASFSDRVKIRRLLYCRDDAQCGCSLVDKARNEEKWWRRGRQEPIMTLPTG
jgi:hypothetical protein